MRGGNGEMTQAVFDLIRQRPLVTDAAAAAMEQNPRDVRTNRPSSAERAVAWAMEAWRATTAERRVHAAAWDG